MGELIVSGGGSTAVATAELFEEAARLGAVEAVLSRWHATFVELHDRLETLAGTSSAPLQLTRASDPLGQAAVDLIRERDAHVVVSSFDLGTIDAVREYAPELNTGFLVHQLDLPVASARAREHGHAWLNPDVTSTLADLGSVALVHELGLQVAVWTVDDPAQIRTLATAGVDAIITNAPDVVLDALA